MMSRPRIKKPQVRMAQPKPTSLIIRLTMMGKMTPPMLEPVERIPKAAPRFLSNHAWIVDRAGHVSETRPA